MSSPFGLLRKQRFAPLFFTQFFGALNDIIILVTLIAVFAYQAAENAVIDASSSISLAVGLLSLPFILLSAVAGQLGDTCDKGNLIRKIKLFEICITALAAAGLAVNSSAVIFSALLLLGVRSSMFGPVKYATLAQHLERDELLGGNALVASMTLLTIFVGFLSGAWLAGRNQTVASTAFIAIAILGYVCSRRIPSAPAPDPDPDPDIRIKLGPLATPWGNLASIRSNRTVFLSILGVSWFWFCCTAFFAQIPGLVDGIANGTEYFAALPIGLFAAGMFIGSLASDFLSDGKAEIGLVPIGSLGLTLFALDLAFVSRLDASTGMAGEFSGLLTQTHAWRVASDLVLLGVFGGVYLVPLTALIQTRCEPAQRARVVAGNNILNAIFVVAAIVFSVVLRRAGLSLAQVFLVLGILNAGVALYIYRVVPEFLMRLVVWGLVHTAYRLRKSGLENVPDEGPVIVVCNHVSFVDAVVISAACRRPIRFVTDHRIFAMPVLNFVFRVTRAIPIASPREDIDLLRRAYAEISRALDAGDIVGIFPEGRITDSGEITPFQNGIRRIIDRNPVPVVPMALRGLWGSFFSRKDAPAMTRPLRRGLFNRIELVVAPGIPPDQATPRLLQHIVTELRGDWK
ncbi:MAG: MFS transporter [Rhodocyclaceae bacterium]